MKGEPHANFRLWIRRFWVRILAGQQQEKHQNQRFRLSLEGSCQSSFSHKISAKTHDLVHGVRRSLPTRKVLPERRKELHMTTIIAKMNSELSFGSWTQAKILDL